MIEDLAAFQRIPSISSCAPAVRRAASWLADRLTSLDARRIPLPGPVVAAERRAGAPTVLFYGHFDVVPAGSGWSVPPFSAVRTDGILWGRGVSDDKGPLVAGLHAVRNLNAAGRRVTLKFLYEGEEEIGSPTFPATLRRLGRWLSDVDIIIVCDTVATATGHPTLTRSLRGGLTVSLTATGVGRALHAGRYGGAVPDPARILARAIASLHTPDGRIAINGLATPCTNPVTTCPAITVTALNTPPGPAHTIPATATATLDIRLPPGQNPAEAEHLLAAHLNTVTLRTTARVDPWQLTDLTHPGIRIAREAVRQVWGRAPTIVRSGGSIAAVPLLARAAPNAAILLLGFTLPTDNAHSPNEHTGLNRLTRTAQTLTTLLNRLG